MPNTKNKSLNHETVFSKKRKKKKLSGSNLCSQICRAPEKRRLYSCMLIGHTYWPSAFVVGHSR